jgi:hypothetical protein
MHGGAAQFHRPRHRIPHLGREGPSGLFIASPLNEIVVVSKKVSFFLRGKTKTW